MSTIDFRLGKSTEVEVIPPLTEISDHFNQKENNENHQCLRVFVFKNNLIDEDKSRDFELDIIGIFELCRTVKNFILIIKSSHNEHR